MALTRKLLSALGIEADKIEQIIEAHTETVDALKKERDEYRQQAEDLPVVQKELDDLKKIKEGDSTYKEKYEKEHQAFEDYKTTIEAKETKQTKQNLYKELLTKAGVSSKRLDAILRVTDFDKIELDEKGAIKNADQHEKNIVKDWSDFIEKKETRGAETHTPPENNGGNGGDSYAAQRAAQLQAQLYGTPQSKK